MAGAIGFLILAIFLTCIGFASDWNIFVFFGGLCFGGFVALSEPKQPSAIDVYRGDTTLEITYKDSIAVDSVVVFKNK